MALAKTFDRTIKETVVVEKKVPHIELNLTMEEAEVVRFLVGSVVGRNSSTEAARRVWSALAVVGVSYGPVMDRIKEGNRFPSIRLD